MVNANRGFYQLRNLMKDGRPCVPYIGMFMTDVIFIVEGSVANREGYIFFSGCRNMHRCFTEFVKPLPEEETTANPEVGGSILKILNMIPIPEEELYEMSLLRETRDQTRKFYTQSSSRKLF
eukprot:TRINITY_DN1180_c0_g1_i2.p1 TRINITY_DN1180_c0_g1~~TRINITY_DN1180_c0_g1_i2.p1  ORF type:complete len:122 (-),score=21.45 TRINITY_DN1180_c0_g1_i2:41-406(-)